MHHVMYKSVVCQEELYFAEIVRAIHLNPLRAGIVTDVRELNRYPYCGHSAVLGRSRRPWPATEDVLTSFGKTVAQARKAYVTYVAAGVPQGRRDDRSGGGLIRTLGGWAAVADRREPGHARLKSDERIVGEADLGEAIVNQAKAHATRQTAWTRRGVGFEQLVARVAEIFRVDPHDVVAQGRQRRRVSARSLLGFWAVRELGVSLAEVARQLGLSPPGVGYAVQRGEALVRENRYQLVT